MPVSPQPGGCQLFRWIRAAPARPDRVCRAVEKDIRQQSYRLLSEEAATGESPAETRRSQLLTARFSRTICKCAGSTDYIRCQACGLVGFTSARSVASPPPITAVLLRKAQHRLFGISTVNIVASDLSGSDLNAKAHTRSQCKRRWMTSGKHCCSCISTTFRARVVSFLSDVHLYE